jgi:hypothetical protein
MTSLCLRVITTPYCSITKCSSLKVCDTRSIYNLILYLYFSILKVKVKLFLCFNWAPPHEGVLGEWRYGSTHSLTSTLDGSELSASRLGCFTPRERAPATHWIGGWVSPRASLDAVVKRKRPSPCRDSKLLPSSPKIYKVLKSEISKC